MARDNSYKKPGDVILTIPIDPALHRRLKIHAATKGKTMKELGTEALKLWLKSGG